MSNLLNDQAPVPQPDPFAAVTSAAAAAAAAALCGGADRTAATPDGTAAVSAHGAPARPASVLRLAPPPRTGSWPPVRAAIDAAPPVRELDSVLGPLLLRPMGATDAPGHAAFLAALGAEDRSTRRFALPPAPRPATGACVAGGAQLLLLLLPAPASAAGGVRDAAPCGVLGELCVCIDRGCVAAEFALAVLPERRGLGLGRILMGCLMEACRARRVALMCASVPAGGAAMLALARACGFQVLRAADGTAQLALMLRPRGVR